VAAARAPEDEARLERGSRAGQSQPGFYFAYVSRSCSRLRVWGEGRKEALDLKRKENSREN
jgi:hypothetical protein